MQLRTPVRVSHSYTQTLAAKPSEVMPLLCPVREIDWVPGWQPHLVISASGVAERDCTFTTPDGDREATWVITEHDADAGTVEMLKVVPDYLVTRLRITLRDAPNGGSYADVRYTYTALGAEGEEYVNGRTAEAYAEFMRDWESALNAHLASSRGRQPS